MAKKKPEGGGMQGLVSMMRGCAPTKTPSRAPRAQTTVVAVVKAAPKKKRS